MGKGLIPADLETWKPRRRAIVPAFHKAYLEAMLRMFCACTRQSIEKFERLCADGQVSQSLVSYGYSPRTSHFSVLVPSDSAVHVGVRGRHGGGVSESRPGHHRTRRFQLRLRLNHSRISRHSGISLVPICEVMSQENPIQTQEREA